MKNQRIIVLLQDSAIPESIKHSEIENILIERGFNIWIKTIKPQDSGKRFIPTILDIFRKHKSDSLFIVISSGNLFNSIKTDDTENIINAISRVKKDYPNLSWGISTTHVPIEKESFVDFYFQKDIKNRTKEMVKNISIIIDQKTRD